MRFYQNLLGAREELEGGLSRTEALTEAKFWLRNLPLDEANRLLARLPGGDRGSAVPIPASKEAAHPFAHPHYWAGFVLIGAPGETPPPKSKSASLVQAAKAEPEAEVEKPASFGGWIWVAAVLVVLSGALIGWFLHRLKGPELDRAADTSSKQ